LPVLRERAGVFTTELLGELLWNAEHGPTEQQHFLSLMLNCRVCFKLGEHQYVLPDCLPARAQRQTHEYAVWRGAAADAVAELHFAFLHEGIKRLLLCELGGKAGVHAVHWRWGLCYFDTQAKVAVRVDCEAAADNHGGSGALGAPAARAGLVRVEVAGPAARDHAMGLVESILTVAQQRGEVQVTWPVGGETTGANAGPGPSPGTGTVPAGSTANPLALSPGSPAQSPPEPFANLRAGPRPPSLPAHQARVHVSYAWETESQALVAQVEAALRPVCDWRRDQQAMRPGDWISRFMAEIGSSACVVVVLSQRYLQSHYCMRELLSLYQTSQGDKAAMLGRVVPMVLPSAHIDRAESRLQHAKYWKARYDDIARATEGLDMLEQGETTRRELLAVADFKHHVVDMLAWLADVLMPRVGAKASADGDGDGAVVAAAAELVRQRLGA
jgi:internalin A